LGWLEVPSTIPALRAAAVDAQLDIEVRGHATEALGVMQARDAVPDLIALLSHESPELRYWAAYSLGEIGDPASIPELERVAAKDAGFCFRHGSVKQEALEALAAIRQPRTS
jgi:HEAT repeat protein